MCLYSTNEKLEVDILKIHQKYKMLRDKHHQKYVIPVHWKLQNTADINDLKKETQHAHGLENSIFCRCQFLPNWFKDSLHS